METNYSRHDKLKPNRLWEVGVVIAIPIMLFSYAFKSMKDKYDSKPDAESKQISKLEILGECEGGMK